MYELNIYRIAICHGNKESYKLWKESDLHFQNWHEIFDELWRKHSKTSKCCTLMGSFWTKYIIFELKKYRKVIFHDTEEGWKIWK